MEREDLLARIEYLEARVYGLEQICRQLAKLPDNVDFVWPKPPEVKDGKAD